MNAVANTPSQAELAHKQDIRDQQVHNAEHKEDDKKQIPVEHHQVAQLNAILLALEAMQDSRIVDEHNASVDSSAIDALSQQMTDLNTQLAGINGYVGIDPGLKGDQLAEAIAAQQAANSKVDAQRSIVEGQYGNDKLLVQQKQTEIGGDVNAVVQQLQQSAGLLNQLQQLSRTVSGG